MLRTDFLPGSDQTSEAMQSRLEAIARDAGRGDRLATHRVLSDSVHCDGKRYPTQV